jgi:hypothetical protein
MPINLVGLHASPGYFTYYNCNCTNRLPDFAQSRILIVSFRLQRPFAAQETPSDLAALPLAPFSSKIRIAYQASVYDEACIKHTYTTSNMADRFPSIEDIDAGEPEAWC